MTEKYPIRFTLVQRGVIEIEGTSLDDAIDAVYGSTVQHLTENASSLSTQEVLLDSVEREPDQTLHIITRPGNDVCESCGVSRQEFVDLGQCFTDEPDLFLNERPSGFTPCRGS